MKGKIEVSFTISNYGADPRVTTRALLRKKGSNAKKGSLTGALILSPYHEIKNYETLQLICANYGKLDELDAAIENPRGGMKVIIPNMPAEFIHAKRRSDGTEYDAVLVNFGSEEAPHVRIFYLSDLQSNLITKGFKPEYKFDLQEDYDGEEEFDDEDVDE